MSNQHYFDVPFAFSGDVTAIPDPLQVGGTVSFTEGWNYNYQRNLSTDPAALPIDRSTMNWLFLQITTALQALQKETIPEFITSAQNGGTAIAYNPQARVLWSASGSAPFTAYVNILGTTNSNTPSASDPGGTTTGWQISCDPISTSAQAAAGTNNASIITPLLLAQQTALRALLAGSSSQVFNVGAATAASHAVPLSQVQGLTTGRLLRRSVYTNVGGTLFVSVNGGTPTSTGATSFTALAATNTLVIEGVGAGGGGGAAVNTSSGQLAMGGAGGAGSHGKGMYTAGFSGAQAIAVSVGGAGGTGGTGGSNGGPVSVGSLFAAPGGNGGGVGSPFTPPAIVGGGNGGTAPTGANIFGHAGQQGVAGNATQVGVATTGQGGSSAFGAGGNQVTPGNNGVPGFGYGSGGSGGCTPQSSSTGTTGGAGGNGLLIIDEYA